MDASPEQSSGTGRPKYPMYHVQLPPEQARELVEKGGALLILDLSEGAVFGVDHQARDSTRSGHLQAVNSPRRAFSRSHCNSRRVFGIQTKKRHQCYDLAQHILTHTHTSFIRLQMFLTGPRFKGVKMLPPGPHFFFTKAASGQGDYAPTCGFFLHVAPRSVHVRRWDPQLELLVALADEEEAERYAAGVRRYVGGIPCAFFFPVFFLHFIYRTLNEPSFFV